MINMNIPIVYFTNFNIKKNSQNKINKLKNIFHLCNPEKIIKKDDLTAIKVHFGEEGNDSYLNPIYVRTIVDCVKELKAIPFVTDTNTLYDGSRKVSPNHIELALKHGFNYTVINAPITISDGLKGKSEYIIEINKKHFKNIRISHDISESNNMIVLSHFKGHSLSGFGGALKNLSMGCASKSGKYEQHAETNPIIINEKCTGCKICIRECPSNSIRLINNKATINYSLCTSCGSCLLCPNNAIIYEKTTINNFMERMMEYAYGVIKQKNKKILYINFLEKITPHCDCVSWTDKYIVPDIGILASNDPVALDKACYDLIKLYSDENIFSNIYPNINCEYQLDYSEELGIGYKKYKLIEV